MIDNHYEFSDCTRCLAGDSEYSETASQPASESEPITPDIPIRFSPKKHWVAPRHTLYPMPSSESHQKHPWEKHPWNLVSLLLLHWLLWNIYVISYHYLLVIEWDSYKNTFL
jgi:hypothetical protein